MVCFFFHARVIIGADAELSQGACERATRKWGPRDGADAKVLERVGEEGELSAGGGVKGGAFFSP